MGKLPDVWKIKQSVSEEVCEWFRKFNNTNNARVDGLYTFLVYDSIINSTHFKGVTTSEDIPEITLEQFKRYVLMEDNNKNKIISSEQAQKIIDIACENWKKKLSVEWGVSIVLRRDIEIEEHFYKTMRKACTKEQHLVFDEIFGKDVIIPEKGTLVYVRDGVETCWHMRFYREYSGGKHLCFNDQKKEGSTTSWRYISLTNPLLEEPKLI